MNTIKLHKTDLHIYYFCLDSLFHIWWKKKKTFLFTSSLFLIFEMIITLNLMPLSIVTNTLFYFLNNVCDLSQLVLSVTKWVFEQMKHTSIIMLYDNIQNSFLSKYIDIKIVKCLFLFFEKVCPRDIFFFNITLPLISIQIIYISTIGYI